MRSCGPVRHLKDLELEWAMIRRALGMNETRGFEAAQRARAMGAR